MPDDPSPEERWNQAKTSLQDIRSSIGKVIVGQDEVVDQMLVALLFVRASAATSDASSGNTLTPTLALVLPRKLPSPACS